MPFYQFTIHGRDEQVAEGQRGFWTTRHAFDVNREAAAVKALALLAEEFTTGASATIWASSPPTLEIDETKRIGWLQALSAPNKGSTFYDERG
jgi:hypothetical protein